MKNITRRAALLVVAGAPLAACGTTQSTSTGDMSPDDLDFVTNAFNIIQFDRDECTIAQTQAKAAEVRAIAAELLKQANDFDAQLRPIAAAAGISPPTVLRTGLKIRAGRLRLGQGSDFDRSFIEDQIYSHEDALNMQQMLMDLPGGNPQLKALSRQGTALVQTNLAKLHALQRQLMLGT